MYSNWIPKPLQVIKDRITSFVAYHKPRSTCHKSREACDEPRAACDESQIFDLSSIASRGGHSFSTGKPVVNLKAKPTLKLCIPTSTPTQRINVPKLFVTPPTRTSDIPAEDSSATIKLWIPFGDDGALIKGDKTLLDIPQSEISLVDEVPGSLAELFGAVVRLESIWVRKPKRRRHIQNPEFLLVPENTGKSRSKSRKNKKRSPTLPGVSQPSVSDID